MTPLLKTAPAATLCLTLLAACGGGGGGSASTAVTAPNVTQDPVIPGPASPTDPADPADPVPTTSDGQRAAATDLLADWAPNGTVDYTALGAVPAAGRAVYTGFLYGDLSVNGGDTTDSLVGRLTLAVDFGADTADFTGLASNFVDARDAPLSGSLMVSGGSFNRDGNPASDATLRGIAVDGVLQDGDGVDWDFGVRLEGDFLGDTAEAVGGEALGRVTIGTAARDFDGGFIAQD